MLVASEPNRESRKTALLMQQQEEQDWESSAAAAASATASATGSLAATAAAAAVKERAAAMDDAAMREWQRFVQQSRMGEVEQLWDPNMVEDEPQVRTCLCSAGVVVQSCTRSPCCHVDITTDCSPSRPAC